MTNRKLLDSVIKESGFKKQWISDQLGLSRQGLRLKLIGNNDFTETEMQKLSSILNLSKSMRDKIFFAQEVDK